MKQEKIDRLLRAARQAGEDDHDEMPFGFDTRLVALWRAAMPWNTGVLSLLRRVALISAAVIVVSTIGVVREANQTREVSESFTNEFAIADSAIQDEFLR